MSAAHPIPGPWHYETTPQGKITVYATRNGDDDKIIIGVSQFGPLEQREANARLIAAAPELYEALRELADHNGKHPAHHRALAALTKARGEA